MSNNLGFKIESEGLEIEYEVRSYKRPSADALKTSIHNEIAELYEQLEELKADEERENKDIDRLTNHADGLDYTIAVASGILCGMIDSFFVGEFSLTKANEWGTEKVEKFVQFVAKQQSGKEKDLYESIRYLENRWKIPSDNKAGIFGGAIRHHLYDFAHHPTPVGLFFSLLTQFTGNAYGVDSFGVFKVEPITSIDLIGKDIPTKVSLGLITWFFHLVSDIAGSSSSIGLKRLGTGLPGPLVSFLYEVSKIPCFSPKNGDSNFTLWISRLWNGALRDANGNRMPVRFDMRTELGVLHELGKQSIPVIVNECLVRGFYFIRRFVSAVKENPIHSLA